MIYVERERTGRTRPIAPTLRMPLAAALVLLAGLPTARAQAPVEPCPPGGIATELFTNNPDDDSVAYPVPPEIFPDGIPYIDELSTVMFVNTNGNVSFGQGNFIFTPDAIPGLSLPTIAPFYADVDLRNRPDRSNPGRIEACDDVAGRRILLTWRAVPHFPANDGTASFEPTRLNTFQMILSNPAFACDGDGERRVLDVEFRYERLAWHAGTATGANPEGLCEEPLDLDLCKPAVAGFDSGDFVTAFQVPGSLGLEVQKLLTESSNTGERGVFQYRLIDGELPRCGNGVIDDCEECDDGNDVSGDGCSAICIVEFCGDGLSHAALGEECDDGNGVIGDGCDNLCIAEVCGNGVLQRGEACDDGNNAVGDGCDELCRVEECGNAVVQHGEECDDGNDASGDGCDATCALEDLSSCLLDPTLCERPLDTPPVIGLSGGGCSAGTDGAGLLVVLALLGWLVRRRASARAVAGVLACAAIAGPAHAQMLTRDFPIERFRLAGDGEGLLGAEWAGVGGQGGFSVALWLGAADDPLVVYDAELTTRPRWGALVSHRVSGTLVGSAVIRERIQLGLELPLVLSQGADPVPGGLPLQMDGELAGFGVGDIRLFGKWQLVASERFDLAVIPSLTVPSSAADDFRGEGGPTLAPELAISRRMGRVRATANLGYRMRQRIEVINLAIDDEVFANLGAGVKLRGYTGRELELQFGVSAATAATLQGESNQNHLETLAGATFAIEGPWRAIVAGGVGVREGFGTPDWRAIAGARYDMGRAAWRDADGDGLADTEDECPLVPEDLDQFRDHDGCPEYDNDRDGVLDVDDGAPLVPEDRDRFEDGDGVPDPDNDGDGILDPADACPVDPEIVNDWRDDDGCPDTRPDTDGDGLWDVPDRCPQEPEDADGFEDEDGCPDVDDDGDGIVDTADACRREAGPMENGGCPDLDRDGDQVVDRLDNCPDEPGEPENFGCVRRQLVKLEATRLVILRRVHFEFNRAKILPASHQLLMNVAQVLRAHPEIAKVRVEGHTDWIGSDNYNQGLSQRRANAVVQFLVRRGKIAPERLVPRGFGESRPIAPNTTDAGRAKNRRVEFNIVADEGAEAPAQGDAAAAPSEAPAAP